MKHESLTFQEAGYDKTVQAVLTKASPPNSSHVGLILAHGAGGDLNTPHLTMLAEGLAVRGISVLRHNHVVKSRVPQNIPAFLAAVNLLSQKTPCARVFFGGHSMGARVAACAAIRVSQGQMMGEEEGDDDEGPTGPVLGGVILLSYPLHPPADPSRLRMEPLQALPPTVPVLFVSGTKDPFIGKNPLSLLKAQKQMPGSKTKRGGVGEWPVKHKKKLKQTAKHTIWSRFVEGGNHGLAVGKRVAKAMGGEEAMRNVLLDDLASWLHAQGEGQYSVAPGLAIIGNAKSKTAAEASKHPSAKPQKSPKKSTKTPKKTQKVTKVKKKPGLTKVTGQSKRRKTT